MSEEIQVKAVQNTGAKSRWGLSSFIYKTEGKKRSLNTKLVILSLSFFITVSTSYSLISTFFNSNSIPNNSIGLKSMLPNHTENSELINVNSLSTKSVDSKNKLKMTDHKFMGAQIINRQNKVQIPGGTLVKAQILTQSAQGLVRALLTEAVVIQGEEIIPAGSTISGLSQSTDDRLQIRFNKILDKAGTTYPIQAVACDESDQALGIKGKKSSRAAWLLATSTSLSVLSQAASGLNANSTNNMTNEEKLKKSAINEASKNTLEESQNYLADFKNQKSMIQVDSGAIIFILFEGE